MADPELFGLLLWNLSDQLIQPLEIISETTSKLPFENKISVEKYEKMVLLYFQTLKYVIPCGTCRQSYRDLYDKMPPKLGQSWTLWLWKLHDKVNKKLYRLSSINKEAYKRRLKLWVELISKDRLWNLLIIIALNYPKKYHKTEDGEYDIKIQNYHLFIEAISYCLSKITMLESIVPYLNDNKLILNNNIDRIDYYKWMHNQHLLWAIDQQYNQQQLKWINTTDQDYLEYLL